jgi:hypothetical protein
MNDANQEKARAGEPASAKGPVAVFDSIHAVLAAERAFLTAGLACDLIPVPRGLASDCGMALVFRNEDLEAAQVLLSRPPLGSRLRGIFIPSPGGYGPETKSDPGSIGHGAETKSDAGPIGHGPETKSDPGSTNHAPDAMPDHRPWGRNLQP